MPICNRAVKKASRRDRVLHGFSNPAKAHATSAEETVLHPFLLRRAYGGQVRVPQPEGLPQLSPGFTLKVHPEAQRAGINGPSTSHQP